MPTFKKPYDSVAFDSNGNVLAVGNSFAIQHANYLTAVAAGFAEPQIRFDQAEADAIVASLNKDPETGKARPTIGLLAAVNALDSVKRNLITDFVEAVLRENGTQITFDRDHPSTPLQYLGDACVYAFVRRRSTGKIFALMKVRGNQSFSGLIEPTGNGFRSDENGQALTALEDAKREMKEESNLAGAAKLIGVNRESNTLQAKRVLAEDGQHMVALMPATSSISAVELLCDYDDVIAHIGKLNSEAFAFLPIPLSQFERYARGESITVSCYPSLAPEAQACFDRAIQSSKVGRLTLTDLRIAMREALPIPTNKQAKYKIASKPIQLVIHRDQAHAVGRDHGAEMIFAAMALGYSVSPVARAYAETHAKIGPINPNLRIENPRYSKGGSTPGEYNG